MLELGGRRVFVAGATGLAGSAAVRALIEANPDVEVVAAHRGRDGAFLDDPRVEYVSGDLCAADDCLRMSKGCDLAVMAAARTGGSMASQKEPWAQVTDNVIMDARMLEAFHRNGVARVVYVSTASAYQPIEGYAREDQLDWSADPPEAHLGVGWVKRYGEKACWFWHKKAGMQCILLRLANIFGPYARFDPEVSNFIPATVRKAVDGMDPFVVWGSPGVTRDVIYADDFGAAVVAGLRHDEIAFDVFNVGSGVRTTVGDVVSWAIEAAGAAPSAVQYTESAPTALPFRALDVSKARTLLGWAPKVSVQEGVRRTVEWWRRNRGTWTR